MANAISRKPVLSEARRKEKVVYEERSFLWVIKWWVKMKAETIKEDLFIVIPDPEKYEKVFVNGQEIKTNE